MITAENAKDLQGEWNNSQERAQTSLNCVHDLSFPGILCVLCVLCGFHLFSCT
jgi:hypothetical protein